MERRIKMNNLSFKKIDETNKQLVQKVTLKPSQIDFIETVDECLKEAEEFEEWRPIAIYLDETVVGFAMYGSFGPNRHTWIDRIIIDENYQGLGLGKQAMKGLIQKVSAEYEVDVLYLSIVPENKVAYALYTQLGFEYMNEKDPNDELIFEYSLK